MVVIARSDESVENDAAIQDGIAFAGTAVFP